MCVCFKMKKKKKIPSIFWILHIKKWKNLKASSVDVKCHLQSLYELSVLKNFLCQFINFVDLWLLIDISISFFRFSSLYFYFNSFFFTVYGNIHGKVAYGRELHVVMMYVTYILICSVVIEFNGCMCFLFMV